MGGWVVVVGLLSSVRIFFEGGAGDVDAAAAAAAGSAVAAAMSSAGRLIAELLLVEESVAWHLPSSVLTDSDN